MTAPSLMQFAQMLAGVEQYELEPINIPELTRIYRDADIVKIYADGYTEYQNQLKQQIQQEFVKIEQNGLSQGQYQFIGDSSLKQYVKSAETPTIKFVDPAQRLRRQIQAEIKQIQEDHIIQSAPAKKQRETDELKESKHKWLEIQNEKMKKAALNKNNQPVAEKKERVIPDWHKDQLQSKEEMEKAKQIHLNKMKQQIEKTLVHKETLESQVHAVEYQEKQFEIQTSYDRAKEHLEKQNERLNQTRKKLEARDFTQMEREKDKQIKEKLLKAEKRLTEYNQQQHEKLLQKAQQLEEKVKKCKDNRNQPRQPNTIQRNTEIKYEPLYTTTVKQEEQPSPDVQRIRTLTQKQNVIQCYIQNKKEELVKITNERRIKLQKEAEDQKLQSKKFKLLQEIREIKEKLQGTKKDANKYKDLEEELTQKEEELQKLR
ncbi:Conserved_hypothetical protein [Hexamita inflata]|uniref:Uncharacterized protein n=1 Tax=Hexamita inflata TaxID=28002 RepID=A0AA86ULE1_9EUKA|nr:Conserved hypothetical protein [Hexamita inflata]CAI9955946.1 Conserved hypothetical protein [Hexamita inflata]CAI9956706.1 Conserved hypothetical protein [Hexamita inflata]